ncbi:hypothetical protein EGW08_022050 [Elysia chlorotica]|uniref:F-box domain-containing protein n=1 Tax=Elysia chlorotica TaxID=188477 RepID=A0A433SM04_ELYCH|nr:hypothetical protein EGW08_022050 [Elysia chlorotica]
MSSVNVIAENAFNKVLPGDKSGLPWEIWQFVLSWMSAGDLCRVACVCKTWNDLVVSIDGTRWKQLYMACSEWRHPFWPLNTQAEPASWRLAYRDQYLATKFWRHRQQLEARAVSCSLLFQKSVARKTIHVGPSLEHESLKSALSVINEYDRVVVHPGIYDELFEISSKIPFELVGEGELGSVILVVGIQQVGAAARLSNLVLRAPWFTSFIIMLNSGYLQIDSCILEDGMICAQNPATVHIKFCTFRHATVILQHMNASIVENCEFSQSDSANIIVEGYPKEERNWTYGFLRERTDAVFSQKRSLHRKRKGLKTTTSLASSTVQSSLTEKSITTNGGGWSSVTTGRQQSSDAVSHDPSFSMEDPGASFLNPSLFPGTRFLMLPPDTTGMVGCGDLQSLYHDGTCDTADQASSHLVDGAKRGSVSGLPACHQNSEPGKERNNGEKHFDKDFGMTKLPSTEESESKSSKLFLGPAKVHSETVNKLSCQGSCSKDKQNSVANKLSQERLQEAWVESESSNKNNDLSITRKHPIAKEAGRIENVDNTVKIHNTKCANEKVESHEKDHKVKSQSGNLDEAESVSLQSNQGQFWKSGIVMTHQI